MNDWLKNCENIALLFPHNLPWSNHEVKPKNETTSQVYSTFIPIRRLDGGGRLCYMRTHLQPDTSLVQRLFAGSDSSKN